MGRGELGLFLFFLSLLLSACQQEPSISSPRTKDRTEVNQNNLSTITGNAFDTLQRLALRIDDREVVKAAPGEPVDLPINPTASTRFGCTAVFDPIPSSVFSYSLQLVVKTASKEYPFDGSREWTASQILPQGSARIFCRLTATERNGQVSTRNSADAGIVYCSQNNGESTEIVDCTEDFGTSIPFVFDEVLNPVLPSTSDEVPPSRR
jgi:hypothetical protein